jgi:hypothetical protein
MDRIDASKDLKRQIKIDLRISDSSDRKMLQSVLIRVHSRLIPLRLSNRRDCA